MSAVYHDGRMDDAAEETRDQPRDGQHELGGVGVYDILAMCTQPPAARWAVTKGEGVPTDLDAPRWQRAVVFGLSGLGHHRHHETRQLEQGLFFACFVWFYDFNE